MLDEVHKVRNGSALVRWLVRRLAKIYRRAPLENSLGKESCAPHTQRQETPLEAVSLNDLWFLQSMCSRKSVASLY